ncbi:hypothetical protein E9549_08155 [Blastococcus sp. MG754426]|uniref:hypothetical protein n=1 Tax=unclassified Blastococcus TaxID=2619396 RepID=UPI001EF043AE|nr:MULTISPECIES: hypothetical protein [unclassified Blastococcus]MCF6507379.1 hypothetical protein [Blastococcus sp. MG754426]MCF6511451.1 hypothetical protein [Blastococcus sp. MG754427]
MGVRPLRLFEEPHQRATVRIEVGARSCWLYGRGLVRLLEELDIARMRDWHPDRKGVLMCPINRVGDLLALLEHRDRRIVELSSVDR